MVPTTILTDLSASRPPDAEVRILYSRLTAVLGLLHLPRRCHIGQRVIKGVARASDLCFQLAPDERREASAQFFSELDYMIRHFDGCIVTSHTLVARDTWVV